MRILLVEDDNLLGDGLRAALGKAGFTMVWVKDGNAALDLVPSGGFSAMVLDIGLPGISGMDVLRELRSVNNTLPVLILTARDTTRDKVLGLNSGADDYLNKTVDMEELIARLRALIRRAGCSSKGQLCVGNLTLDMVMHSVSRNGNSVTVSGCEFAILRALMEGSGRILTRSQLEATLHGWTRTFESNAIEVHIHNLRLKIGSEAIKTVRGVGYTLARVES